MVQKCKVLYFCSCPMFCFWGKCVRSGTGNSISWCTKASRLDYRDATCHSWSRVICPLPSPATPASTPPPHQQPPTDFTWELGSLSFNYERTLWFLGKTMLNTMKSQYSTVVESNAARTYWTHDGFSVYRFNKKIIFFDAAAEEILHYQ